MAYVSYIVIYDYYPSSIGSWNNTKYVYSFVYRIIKNLYDDYLRIFHN